VDETGSVFCQILSCRSFESSLSCLIRLYNEKCIYSRSRDRLASVAAKFRFRAEAGHSVPTGSVSQPHIQWIPGVVSPGLKRPGREADHLALCSVAVRMIEL
jgi:hypothetical protein